jgi:monothiol glutaredoxin
MNKFEPYILSNQAIWKLETGPSARVVYAAGAEGTVTSYNIETATTTCKSDLKSGWINGLCYSRFADSLVAATSRGVIQCLNPHDLSVGSQISCANHWINGIRAIPSTGRILIPTAEGLLLICDVLSGTLLEFPQKHSDQVWDCAVSSCGTIAASMGGNGEVALWDLAELQFLGWFSKGGYIVTSGVMIDSRQILGTVDMGGVLTLWSLADRHAIFRFHAHDARIWGVAKSADEQHLVTVGADYRVCVWDVDSCHLVYEWQVTKCPTTCVWSNLGSLIVGNHDGTISILGNPSDVENIAKTTLEITKILSENEIVIFINGTRTKQTGAYSARVVAALNQNRLTYVDVDISNMSLLRSSLERLSGCPRFPQVYIKGRFLGGSKVLDEMLDSGAFNRMLASI